MRKVTGHLFASVDGVVEAPNLFQFDQFDDGCGRAMAASLANADAMVLGRVLYQEWADYWPGAADPFAHFINPVAKYVASRTLIAPLEWQNSALIPGELEDFVQELKRTDGGDIILGGISVIRQLFRAGLVDNLTFTVHPVLGADGRRLFEDSDPLTRMTLVDSQITEKGNAILSYALKAD